MDKWLDKYVAQTMDSQVLRNGIFDSDLETRLCWNAIAIVLAVCYLPTIL